MLNFINKKFFVLSVSVASSFSLHGAYSVLSNIQEQLNEVQSRLEAIEQKTAYGKDGALLAGGLPDVVNSKGLFFEFDVLYFKTQLGGTAFAYSNSYGENSYPINASLQEINFSMDFGLRISGEKEIIGRDWGIRADFTHFRTSGSKSKGSNIPTSQIPLKGVIILDEGVAFTKSIGNVKWNDLQLNLNKSYFVNQTFLLQPLIGLKASWIELNQWSRYSGGPNLTVNTDHVRDQSKFFGIGPNIGNKAEWFLGNNFSLSGLLDIGLEYGIFKVSYDEFLSSDKTKRVKINQTKHQFSPIFDFAIDLNYGFYFNDKHGYTKFSIGYEAVFFLKQNQMLQLYDNYSYRLQNISEDLSLHGITGSASVSF